MEYKKGDVVRILNGEGHYLGINTTAIVDYMYNDSTVFVSGSHRSSAVQIDQILRLDQVELAVKPQTTTTTVASPAVRPEVEVSEEVEIAQRLGDIYGVWSGGRLYSVEDTREDARVVKSDLGGKAQGAFIIQYAIVKEVR
jgi:hypothetical protein